MELEKLIEAVKAAQDKAELEALVKRELEIDLDKRKSLETLRAEVLKGLGVEEGEQPSGGAGAGGGSGEAGAAGAAAGETSGAGGQGLDDGAGETQGQQTAELEQELQHLRNENTELRDALAAEQDHSAQLREQVSTLQFNARQQGALVVGDGLTPPGLDDAGEQLNPPAVDGVRLLRNTENGRDFPWSPELAKLPNMKEL